MADLRPLLDLIGRGEAPHGYTELYSNAEKLTKKPITEMTVREVIDLQAKMKKHYPSTAAGRYQFITKTLKRLVAEGDASLDDTFGPTTQDRLAVELMRERGLSRFLAGSMSLTAYGNQLAQEWASLPCLSGAKKGRSYYDGDGLNHARISMNDFKAALSAVKGAGPFEDVTPEPPMLEVGSTGAHVKALQMRLAELRYFSGAVDGDFGTLTRASVLEFQADNGLTVDGRVGEETWKALDTANPKPLSSDRENATVSDLRKKGSKTIGASDLGQGAVAVGTGASVVKEVGTSVDDPLGKAQDVADKATSFKGLVDTFHDLIGWLASHMVVVLIAGAGIAAIFYLRKIKQARLEDHRSGAHVGR